MASPEPKKDYLELLDVSDNSVIGKVPMDKIKHMPRTGERIFLALHEPGDWAAYKIMDIEYFLGTLERSFDEQGLIRVTLFVEKVRQLGR